MRDAAAAFVRAIIDEGARPPTSGRSTGRLCATTLPAAGGWTVLCSFAGGCASWLSVPSSPVLRRTQNSFSSIFCLALHRLVFNWRTRPGRLAAPTRWRGPAPEQRKCINQTAIIGITASHGRAPTELAATRPVAAPTQPRWHPRRSPDQAVPSAPCCGAAPAAGRTDGAHRRRRCQQERSPASAGAHSDQQLCRAVPLGLFHSP